jgi:predicted small lipoprotein YifL
MRKVLSSFTALAALALVPLVAGCGADDLGPEAVAEAAQQTREARTARVEMTVRASGFGVPIPLTVRGEGTSALDRAAMDLELDLAPLLSLAGVQAEGDTRLVVLGKDVYVKPPRVQDLTLPEDAEWVGLDLARTLGAMGVDAEGFAALVNADPGAQLDALTSAKGMEEVGEEEIDGVATTHFRGEVAVRDLIAALPPDRRREAQEAYDDLLRAAPGGDQPQAIDVWVDEDRNVRRMRQQVRAPAQEGVPAGRADVTIDYSDFGTPLTAKAPPEGDTWDATDEVAEAVAQQARAAGAGR